MAEICTQDVIDSVLLALAGISQDGYASPGLGGGEMPRGFHVGLESVEMQPLMGTRNRRVVTLAVVYTQSEDGMPCVKMGDMLSLVLEAVKTSGGDLLHGTGMHWRVEENTLYFQVRYCYVVVRPEMQETMETLSVVNHSEERTR